jgi:hypothetical protein
MVGRTPYLCIVTPPVGANLCEQQIYGESAGGVPKGPSYTGWPSPDSLQETLW